jgi:hypothetical protein
MRKRAADQKLFEWPRPIRTKSTAQLIGFTTPTGPYVGTETDLVALYHLYETSGATTLAEAVAA